jgi:predicted AAA+ superfamily ATPase
MDVPRSPATQILHRLETDSRIVLLLGPRQTGKTTLAKAVAGRTGRRFLSLNGDDPETVELLSLPDDQRLSGLVAGYEGLFLDEAQRIPGIGLVLKRLHDQHSEVRLLVTGSSSLELAGLTREALTGRTWTYTLFPIATSELAQLQSPHELNLGLGDRLVLGCYPALFSLPNRQDRVAHLRELVNAYLYKDILELSGLRSARKLRDLLRLLAYQVGSEVSYQELGRTCGLSADTVISYVDLLEKSFVVYRLGAYSRNLRKEVSRKDKVYFVDNGVRNALIDDFKEPELRSDVGALWENFLVSERRKRNAYTGFYGSSWFWRVHTGAELDYLEDADGRLEAFEFKWGDKPAMAPKGFVNAYPDSGFTLVNRSNWQEFCALERL